MRRAIVWSMIGLLALLAAGGALMAVEPKARVLAFYVAHRVVRKVQNVIDPPQSLAAARSSLFDTATAAVIGPPGLPDEASSIVVFIDYNCIFCRRQFRVYEAMAAEGRPPRVILRHLPHSVESIALAQALLAARRQGGVEALHRVMAAADRPLGPGDLPDLARAAGLDPERLLMDAASPEIEALLDGDIKLAWSLRIESTPTMVVGTELRYGVQAGDALAALTAAAAGR